MIVIYFFGRMADVIGQRRVDIEPEPGGERLLALRDRIFAAAFVARQIAPEAVRMSVNQMVARDDLMVRDGDEVAFFSVFSGG